MVPVETWAAAGPADRVRTIAIAAHLCKVINILWAATIDKVRGPGKNWLLLIAIDRGSQPMLPFRRPSSIDLSVLEELDAQDPCRWFDCFCKLAVLPLAARAQGSITGAVKDPSGAVLPGVTVEVASPALIEQSRGVVTDSNGNYRIVDLPPGTYCGDVHAHRVQDRAA